MRPPTSRDVVTTNRTFYDALWQKARLQRPDAFNTWPLVSELLPSAPARLEIGPGLRPRLPIAGTHFIDISVPVVQRLNARGGIATLGKVGTLDFRDGQFDLVCAFDVIEHVEDDQHLFNELSRVLKRRWRSDRVLCRCMRICGRSSTTGSAMRDATTLRTLLAILSSTSCSWNGAPRTGCNRPTPDCVKWGMWCLEHRRTWAMFWYNWVGMPLAMRFQKRLNLVSGLVETTGVDEVVLVCRRARRSTWTFD